MVRLVTKVNEELENSAVLAKPWVSLRPVAMSDIPCHEWSGKGIPTRYPFCLAEKRKCRIASEPLEHCCLRLHHPDCHNCILQLLAILDS
jgi:hypothetical protein